MIFNSLCFLCALCASVVSRNIPYFRLKTDIALLISAEPAQALRPHLIPNRAR